jgi:hypothetical protein
MGLPLVVTGGVHLFFIIKNRTADETSVIACFTSIFSGIGLILAGDGAKSAAAHDETKAALTAMSATIATTAGAAAAGDTSTLTKVATAPPAEIGAVPPVAQPLKTG